MTKEEFQMVWEKAYNMGYDAGTQDAQFDFDMEFEQDAPDPDPKITVSDNSGDLYHIKDKCRDCKEAIVNEDCIDKPWNGLRGYAGEDVLCGHKIHID